MGTESEGQIFRKAMAYDLLNILDETPQETYTKEEVKKLLLDYMSSTIEK